MVTVTKRPSYEDVLAFQLCGHYVNKRNIVHKKRWTNFGVYRGGSVNQVHLIPSTWLLLTFLLVLCFSQD